MQQRGKEQHFMKTEAFEKYESSVRSYCRHFPTVFTTAKGSIIKDEEGNEMESCPHPKQKLKINLGIELEKGDILRVKEQ